MIPFSSKSKLVVLEMLSIHLPKYRIHSCVLWVKSYVRKFVPESGVLVCFLYLLMKQRISAKPTSSLLLSDMLTSNRHLFMKDSSHLLKFSALMPKVWLSISLTRCRNINLIQVLLYQSHGASVMSGKFKGEQQRVRSQAIYIHCFAHILNLVLVDCAKKNSSAAEFFALQSLCVFVSSTKAHVILYISKQNNVPINLKKNYSDYLTQDGLVGRTLLWMSFVTCLMCCWPHLQRFPMVKIHQRQYKLKVCYCKYHHWPFR